MRDAALNTKTQRIRRHKGRTLRPGGSTGVAKRRARPDRIGNTSAIHVYGGDFISQPRSQWGPGPLEERPYDLDLLRSQFEEANTRAGLPR